MKTKAIKANVIIQDKTTDKTLYEFEIDYKKKDISKEDAKDIALWSTMNIMQGNNVKGTIKLECLHNHNVITDNYYF